MPHSVQSNLVDEDSFIDVDVEPVNVSPTPLNDNKSPDYSLEAPIVICLPGNSFSSEFLQSYTNLITSFMQNNIPFVVSTYYNPNIYFCRNGILGGTLLNGKNQKPFNGDLKYSYLLWLDSDIIFTFQNVQDLLKEANKFDFVSGLYSMADTHHYATVEYLDNDFLRKNGSFEFLTPAYVETKKVPFPVAYTGLGFCMMKYGVLESLQYPWFKPKFIQLDDINEILSEDTSVCINLSSNGILPYVCPNIIVGHQKKFIIGPSKSEQDNQQTQSTPDTRSEVNKLFTDEILEDNQIINDFSFSN